MKKTYVVFCVLTTIFALWGMIYYPLQCMSAVRPYTVKPIATLGYSPLVGVGLLLLLGFLVWLESKIKARWNTKERKYICIVLLWFVAAVCPMMNAGAKTAFLQRKTAWTGPCAISSVSLNYENQIVVRLACDNGKFAQIIGGGDLLTKLLKGKTSTCAVAVNGAARCKP